MSEMELPKEVGKLSRDTTYQNKFVDIGKVLPNVRLAIEQGYNIMFRGPTGTGKTYLVKELAKEYKKKLLVLNMTAGATIEEIKGRYVVQPDESGKTVVKWIDGVLVVAMKNGYWVVVEEANFMPEELASVFYSVMDDRRNIILDEHENEEIIAHPEFRMFLTANWGYKGTTIPNDAIRNRIDYYVDLTYLSEKEEARLIVRETGIHEKIANLITKFAWSQRKIKSRNQPDISTRILIRWANLIKNGIDPVDCGENTVISLMYHDDKEKAKVRETMKFEFEAIDVEELMGKTKAKAKSEPASASSEDKAKGYTSVPLEPEEVSPIKRGELVMVMKITTGKEAQPWYGVVTRVTSSRTGDKVWAFWNENKENAIKGIPSKILPIESREPLTTCKVVMTKEEVEKAKGE